jgi:hypothetical protein
LNKDFIEKSIFNKKRSASKEFNSGSLAKLSLYWKRNSNNLKGGTNHEKEFYA